MSDVSDVSDVSGHYERDDEPGDGARRQQMRFFTLCARRDLAQAAVLMEAARAHHPAAHTTIWLLDDGPLPTALRRSTINVRYVSGCLSEDQQVRYWLRYDESGLIEALKPVCFERHFEEGDTAAIYISAYSCIYRPFTDMQALLEAGVAGVITPHITALRAVRAGEAHTSSVVRHGRILNLDLLALRPAPQTFALLTWWRDWFTALQHTPVGDDLAGFYQRMDTAPYLWPDLHVLDNGGYQAAEWNLPGRELATEPDGSVSLDGAPLMSLYVGPLSSSTPQQVTSSMDAWAESARPALAVLLTAYEREVVAHGFWECQLLYRPALTFDDGTRFDPVVQQACRMAMRDGVAVTSLRGTGPGSFREWLRKYPVGGKYPHYIEALFELRPDVAAAMKGGPVEDTLLWIRLHGVRELQLIPALLEAPASDVSTRKPISYLGYVTSELGLGEAARGYMAALKGRGYSLDVVDISDTSYHKRSASYVRGASLNGVLPGGIKILHVNADSLPSVIERIPPETRKDSYCIGIWAWETLEFPDEWSDRFAMLDEIWVGSQFMARAISPKSPIPVVVMPHVIEMPEPQPDRALFGIDPDEYVFLLSFDFSSVRVRKNPLGAIEAFKRAFTPEEPVRLFVKSMHGDRWPEQFLTMRAAAEDGARITFYDGTLSGAQRLALLSSCDTYLSLHRAEGFGLGLAECMAFGKPVVATGWSGNMEFMTHQNAMLVNYQLKPLAAMAGPYPAGTLWAEPDLDDAARKMRQLWLDPELRARLGQQAKQDIAAGFSAQTIGSMLDARLKLVESSMGQAETQRTIRIEQPPSPRGQSFLRRKTVGALRRARRIIKRALA